MSLLSPRVHPYTGMGYTQFKPNAAAVRYATAADPRFGMLGWLNPFGRKKAKPFEPVNYEDLKKSKPFKRSTALLVLLGLFMLPDTHKISTFFQNVFSRDVPLVAPEKLPPGYSIPVTLEYQGNNNGCGPTSIAMSGNAVDPSLQLTRERVDQEVRRQNIYTAPDTMLFAARQFGLKAEVYNHSSFQEIQQHLFMGNPVIALINPGGRDEFNAHYIVISGYRVQPDGKQEVFIHDPSMGFRIESFDDFESQWSNVCISNVPTGYDRAIIVLSKNKLPASRSPYQVLGSAASKTSDLVNTGTAVGNGDTATLFSRDMLSGNLFVFALALVAMANIISPKMVRDAWENVKGIPGELPNLHQHIKALPSAVKDEVLHHARMVRDLLLATPMGVIAFCALLRAKGKPVPAAGPQSVPDGQAAPPSSDGPKAVLRVDELDIPH